MTEKLFAYYRVSTKDQADKNTQENQKNSIDNYVLSLDAKVVESFYDPGMSGADRDRPQFKAMMERIHEVDGIIVYDPDRLSRDFEMGLALMFDLKHQGKKLFVSRTMTVTDFSQGQEQLMHAITSWVSEQERVKIRERQKLGIQRYIENNGEWGRKTIQVNWKKFDEYRGYRISHASIARMMGISPATLWRRIRER